MPRVSVADGMRFFYQQDGRGPDVVLIHGLTGNVAFWHMINLVARLSADFRVTAFDLRGHGYSDTPPTGYTSADMAADVRKLQQALGLGPSYLVGHSYGAVIALHTAVLYPEAVAGVILSDPFIPSLRHLEASSNPFRVFHDGDRTPERRAFDQQASRIGLSRLSEVNGVDFGQLLKQMATLTPEAYEQLRGVLGRHGLEIPDDRNDFDINILTRQLASLPQEQCDMVKRLVGATGVQRMTRLAQTTCRDDIKEEAGLTPECMASVQQPVLALYGEQSPFLATCRYLQQVVPNCRLAFVPKAKHMAPFENAQGFVELVHAHLRTMAGIDGTWESNREVLAGKGIT